MEAYLGIDVGSVTTKFAVLDNHDELVTNLYLPTQGKPITMVQQGLKQIQQQLPKDVEIRGVATTGSARYLAGVIVGADLVKNEITSHAVAALLYTPEVQTIIEIGGQDSKIIIVRDGVVTDFGMNTVCAAGTGSFLDHQALRLDMSIEELETAINIKKNTSTFAKKINLNPELYQRYTKTGWTDITRSCGISKSNNAKILNSKWNSWGLDNYIFYVEFSYRQYKYKEIVRLKGDK